MGLVMPDAVLCRAARKSDVPALVQLCARWQRSEVDTARNGFLQLRYGQDTFVRLVAESTVMVAEEGGTAAGYYLVNVNDVDPAVAIHRQKVIELRRRGMLSETSCVALGSQTVLDRGLQGRGVRQMLLAKLVEHLTGRYDSLFATIPRENTRAYKAHTADGWKVIDEDEKMFYVSFGMPSRECG